jgi:hypothetical protein
LVDQPELEELAEANEVRDEASKANVRLGSASTESTAEIKATSESAKIEEAAELAKISKKTMQDAVQPLAV